MQEVPERAGTVQSACKAQRLLVDPCKYLMGKGKGGRARVFSVVPTDSTRGDRHKSKYQKFHSNIN